MNECKIVQDLMPLYVEELLSEESAEAVRSHTEKCEVCSKMLERCREPMPQMKQDPKAYKKTMFWDAVKIGSVLFIPLIVFCVLAAVVFWWLDGPSYPVEATYVSRAVDYVGEYTIEVADWDEATFRKDRGRGSVLRIGGKITEVDEYGVGTSGTMGRQIFPWENVHVIWAPNGADALLSVQIVDGGAEYFVLDNNYYRDEEGSHHEMRTYPEGTDTEGIVTVLKSLCVKQGAAGNWENASIHFLRWSDDSERLIFVYELDNGTRGFLEYEYKTGTLISVD